jgi:hypothetical protein
MRTAPSVGNVRMNIPAARSSQISGFVRFGFLNIEMDSRVDQWMSGRLGSTNTNVGAQLTARALSVAATRTVRAQKAQAAEGSVCSRECDPRRPVKVFVRQPFAVPWLAAEEIEVQDLRLALGSRREGIETTPEQVELFRASRSPSTSA